MRRCLDLARQGLGSVAPNPMVGSLLIHNDSIIGEGFHTAYGREHAEVNAIVNSAGNDLLRKSILYVNLEPCSHHGKTPPCVNLIIEKRIPAVIVGTPDPNPLVAGRGISILRNKGVSVVSGVLEDECRELNRRFFTWHIKKRPYIILKWARSADGFIDLDRSADAPVGPNWITSQISRTLVHKWRAEEQAILVGTNTVLKDNPRLNVRDWAGQNPLRVIIDRTLKAGNNHHVLDKSQDTLIFTEKDPSPPKDAAGSENHAAPFSIRTAGDMTGTIPGNVDPGYTRIVFDDTVPAQILDHLYNKNIQSLIIEGGACTLNSFIEQGLWDEARIFTGSAIFKSGVKSPEISGQVKESQLIDNSMLHILYNT